MFVNDRGLAEVIGERCEAAYTKEKLTACILSVLQEKQHNKFFQVKQGDLKDVIEVVIIDEEQYEKDIERPLKKRIRFTTTMGKYDPDYMNWYAVIDSIDEGEDALMIVKKKEGF